MLLEIELGTSDSRGTFGQRRTDRGEMEIERECKAKEKSRKETEGRIFPNGLQQHISIKVWQIM